MARGNLWPEGGGGLVQRRGGDGGQFSVVSRNRLGNHLRGLVMMADVVCSQPFAMVAMATDDAGLIFQSIFFPLVFNAD